MSQSQFQHPQRLSVQELLLLNILLYLSDEDSFCFSKNDKNSLFYSVQNNWNLMNLKLVATATILEEGAVCAAFFNEQCIESPGEGKCNLSRELIVVFRGTSKGEWLDNFLGGAATDAEDGVSTRQQIRALKWYQTLSKEDCYVTVTGHSKGGNKAKYIAVLDDSVDHCVSFNGQGFSEEFITWYYARIGIRQQIIENHNTEYDYVNWLLHDFGSSYYYKNQMPEKGFLAGHCASAFLKWDADGEAKMEQTGSEPPEITKALDKTLNQMLHLLPRKQKIELVTWIGEWVQKAMDEVHTDEGRMLKQLLIEISHFFQSIFQRDVIY